MSGPSPAFADLPMAIGHGRLIALSEAGTATVDSPSGGSTNQAAAEACLNCGALKLGPYCHQCGQPHKHFIRSFWTVLWDLLTSALDFDSRSWRTFVLLLHDPGRLSRDYVGGRRHSYVPPLRLYLLVSLALLVLASISNLDRNIELSRDDPPGEASAPTAAPDQPLATTAGTPSDRPLPASIEATDGDASAEGPNIRIGPGEDRRPQLSINGRPFDPVENPFPWFKDSYPRLHERINAYLDQQAHRIAELDERSGEFADVLLSRIAQSMFVLMPLFALLLGLFYLFNRRYLVEHLIVSLHLHCFWFVWLALTLGVELTLDALELFGTPLSAIRSAWRSALYLLPLWLALGSLLMLRRYYQQAWWLTLLKAPLLAACYLLLLTVTSVFAVIASLLTF